jgi:hypothetical protein
MTDYREIARQKYQEHLNKEREKEYELVKKETITLNICLEIEDNIDAIQINNESENILISLINIESIIHNNIDFIKENNKLIIVQDNILKLIDILNKLNQNGNRDITMIKNITNTMTQIFKLVDISIDIESMDTSQDAKIALEMNNKNI